jgi:hypothetical protein
MGDAIKYLIILLLLCNCNYDIKHATPEFIDASRGYARIYKAQDKANPECGEPKYEFVYTGQNINMSDMSGHICLPTEQVQEILRYYNDYVRKQQNCQ